MPFGISTAPEEFQRRQDQVIEGLEGVQTIADDILVYGKGDTWAEATADHDVKLKALLERFRSRNLKLNKAKLKLKLKLKLKQVPFMGHLITAEGLKPDPAKMKAVEEMPKSSNKTELQRFVGFVNYLSKFLPQLSDTCEPLRKLTQKDADWCWLDSHDKAVAAILLRW